MDSNELERERGITILAKNTAIRWGDYRINIVDTPGHADFGGEVERVLSMVDAVLLLVDAVDGPMPQTRFVTQKAVRARLPPDRRDQQDRPPEARARTGCSTRRSTCSIGSARPTSSSTSRWSTRPRSQGFATHDPGHRGGRHEAAVRHDRQALPAADVDRRRPAAAAGLAARLRRYVGAIGIGRIKRGVVRRGMQVAVVERDGTCATSASCRCYGFEGLERIEIDEAGAGDIVAFAGIERPADLRHALRPAAGRRRCRRWSSTSRRSA